MKRLRLNVDSIMPSFTMASSVILSKNTMPILGCLLLESSMEDGRLVLNVSGSDGETWLTLKSIDGVSGDADVSICLGSSEIIKSFRGLAGNEVDMCIDEDKKMMTCKYSNGKFTMPYLDASEYPKAKSIQGGTTFCANSELLMSSIHFVSHATSTENDLRTVLTGLYMSMSYKMGFSAVATDGKMLAKYNDCSVLSKEDFENAFILPKKAANLLYSATCGMSEGKDVYMRSTGDNVEFTTNNFKMLSRLVDGRYPNYDAVIPKAFNMNGIFNKQNLIDGIRRVLPLGDSNSKMLKFSFCADEITIKAECLEMSTEATERIGCDYHGDELSIGLNGDSLLDILKSFDEELIKILMNGQDKPIVFEPFVKKEETTQIALLMPMRL